MTAGEIALTLFLCGTLAGALELLLSQSWARLYWAGPAIGFRRGLDGGRDPREIVAALSRESADALFIAIGFRELRPGFIAFREHAWQRRPCFKYYGPLRGHLRVGATDLVLGVFPTWSAILFVAGCAAALFATQALQLLALLVMVLLGFGGVVQSVRFSRILRTAAAPAPRAAAGGGPA